MTRNKIQLRAFEAGASATHVLEEARAQATDVSRPASRACPAHDDPALQKGWVAPSPGRFRSAVSLPERSLTPPTPQA